MSQYLDELIRRLEVEAEEQQQGVPQITSPRSTTKIKRSTDQLGRTLQRLETLRTLRTAELKRHAFPSASIKRNRSVKGQGAIQ